MIVQLPDYPPDTFKTFFERELGFSSGDAQQLWQVARACAARRVRLADMGAPPGLEGAAEVFSSGGEHELTVPGVTVEFLINLAAGRHPQTSSLAEVRRNLEGLLEQDRSLGVVPELST